MSERQNQNSAAVGRSDSEALLYLAKQVTLPEWATHVAVRKDGSKAEPAQWHDESRSYLDEPPINGEWCGAYKEAYWVFFPRAEVAA